MFEQHQAALFTCQLAEFLEYRVRLRHKAHFLGSRGLGGGLGEIIIDLYQRVCVHCSFRSLLQLSVHSFATL